MDELAKLPSLVKFSCRGNRLLSRDGNPKTASQIVIARLGQLLVLNGCEVNFNFRPWRKDVLEMSVSKSRQYLELCLLYVS